MPEGGLAALRRARAMELMAREGRDVLVVYGNAVRPELLRYVTDFAVLEGHAVAVLDEDGLTLFVETPYEAQRAANETRGVKVRFVPDVIAAARAAAVGRNIGLGATVYLPTGLARAFPDAADLTEAMLLMAVHKHPLEVEAVAEAAAVADRGYAVFRNAIRPGRREYEVIAEVEAFLRAAGCADHFVIMAAGNTEVRGMRPPGDRRIRAGDLVTTEITPSVRGYYAQLCRTLVVGDPSPEQTAAFAVYRDATEAGLALVRPGVTAAEIARAENDVFRARGLGEYTSSTYTRVRGHGLGLNVDSVPSILESEDFLLEAGMTLIVHPNTYHPETGYFVLGDAVAVTDSGHRRLAATPLELFSVPA